MVPPTDHQKDYPLIKPRQTCTQRTKIIIAEKPDGELSPITNTFFSRKPFSLLLQGRAPFDQPLNTALALCINACKKFTGCIKYLTGVPLTRYFKNVHFGKANGHRWLTASDPKAVKNDQSWLLVKMWKPEWSRKALYSNSLSRSLFRKTLRLNSLNLLMVQWWTDNSIYYPELVSCCS